MKISEKRYNYFYYLFLYAISATLIFMRFSTILIILFVFFSLVFYKKFIYSKKDLILILIIASPLVLNILFFWNNDTLVGGVKSIEKYLSLLFFPLLIIGYRKRIDIIKVINVYVFSSTVILLFLFMRYIIFYSENFIKYLNGVNLWQMGYDFANSFSSHAPALNMHICFIFTLSVYVFLKQKDRSKKIFSFIVSTIGLFFLLYVNTRIAIINAIICAFVIIVLEAIKENEKRKLLIKKMGFAIISIFIFGIVFITIYPRLIYKFTEGTFTDMGMIGRIDELDRPETKHGSLVMRVSVWKSTLELAKDNWWYGFGASDAKGELINYFNQTNQKHLAKWRFPVHNQYLDFLLKFGILGIIVCFTYIFFIAYLGVKLNSSIMISFFIIFCISNLTDDFLIRYDGIAFSGLWMSIFANQFKFRSNEES